MKCEKRHTAAPSLACKNLPLAIHHILATFTNLTHVRMLSSSHRLRTVEPQDERSLGPWTPNRTRVTSLIRNIYSTLPIREKLTPFKFSLLDIEINVLNQLMVPSPTYMLKHWLFTRLANARVAFFHLQKSHGILHKTLTQAPEIWHYLLRECGTTWK